MQRLHATSERDNSPVGYIFRLGATMADVLRGVKCFLSSIEAPKAINLMVWPTSTDLKSTSL